MSSRHPIHPLSPRDVSNSADLRLDGNLYAYADPFSLFVSPAQVKKIGSGCQAQLKIDRICPASTSPT